MMPKSIERFQVKNCSNNYSPILAGFKRKYTQVKLIKFKSFDPKESKLIN